MRGAHDGHSGPGPVNSVFKILGFELVGAGHGNGPDLGAPQKHEIPLGNAWKNHQDGVAFANTQIQQRVGKAVGFAFKIAVVVMRDVLTRAVNGDQSQFVVLLGPPIDHLEAKIEKLRNAVGKIGASRRIVKRRKRRFHAFKFPGCSLSMDFSRIRKITRAKMPLAISHMETWIAFCEMA